MEKIYKTFEECMKDQPGTRYADFYEDGIHVLVMRGPFSLCAYLGIPQGHPLAGFNYEDIPLRVHGGLTFGKEGDGDWRPAGEYWYGWDYAHAGDFAFYDLVYQNAIQKMTAKDHKWARIKGHKWTPDEVIEEARNALYDFVKLVRWAETIARKESEKNEKEKKDEGKRDNF
jgi:hypothetical protein